MSRRNGHRGASLYDFRDLDLMHKLAEEGDDEGWIETEHLARSLGFGDDRLRNVGIRLAWMRRYGMLERDEQKGLWRLTDGGLRVVDAKVLAAAKRDLQKLPDAAYVEVMADVTHRFQHADAMTAHLLRREFLFGTQPR